LAPEPQTDEAQLLAAVRETLRSGRVPADALICGSPELEATLSELAGLHEFAMGLASGELDATLKAKGALAGALKGLQAALRHLTWQTERVAAGDFSQRVDFMGDFSAAFNSMVEALAEARAQLADQNEALTRMNARLEILSTTDRLTGAFNRHKLDEVLQREMRRSERHGLDLSVAMLDIDHFKRVNDEFGHEAGDSVLQRIAGLVAGELRTSDVLVRWGGEEFLILAPHTHHRQGTQLAERVRRRVAEQQLPPVGRVTVSLGVAGLRPGESAEQLIARADAALYRAKEGGRDRVDTAA
jgi:diguanylate cyclase (GGDEF)-like protein